MGWNQPAIIDSACVQHRLYLEIDETRCDLALFYLLKVLFATYFTSGFEGKAVESKLNTTRLQHYLKREGSP